MSQPPYNQPGYNQPGYKNLLGQPYYQPQPYHQQQPYHLPQPYHQQQPPLPPVPPPSERKWLIPLIVGVSLLAVVLVGVLAYSARPSQAPLTAEERDAALYDWVNRNAIELDATREDLVGVANAGCGAFDRGGADAHDQLVEILLDYDFTYTQATGFIEELVQLYCPEHELYLP